MSNDLFPGFEERRLAGRAGEIFARIGGSGPPLLCLHGYPQTHVCWHRIAGRLAEVATVVAMDLRGYGASDAPPGDPDHRTYSKRAMAEDCLDVMAALGFPVFDVMGHDRGGRVAYRLAFDHPAAVRKLTVLDILPTLVVWQAMGASAAVKSYHWPFLAQPHPMPERLIDGDPVAYCDHTLRGWTQAKSLDVFDPRALANYRALISNPKSVHAICEDYRAGWHVDRLIDEADRLAGRQITQPTLALWGTDYVGQGGGDPLEVWRRWAPRATGRAIDCGHFLAEEAPEATLSELVPFLTA